MQRFLRVPSDKGSPQGWDSVNSLCREGQGGELDSKSRVIWKGVVEAGMIWLGAWAHIWKCGYGLIKRPVPRPFIFFFLREIVGMEEFRV